jgi:hypothetical protein
MATKNLARTVIEGGRTGYYKSSVETLTSEERAATKEFLRTVRNDPERADEIVNPVRKPVSVSFADKLRPMYRFMDSKLGQNWSKVRSELFRRFDTRTTPGRHVLFDHLLRDVTEGPLPEKGTTRLFRFFTPRTSLQKPGVTSSPIPFGRGAVRLSRTRRVPRQPQGRPNGRTPRLVFADERRRQHSRRVGST